MRWIPSLDAELAGQDGLTGGHFATFPISLAARGVQADLRAGAWMSVWARWRETEIDHVDLDAGYTHSHWPAEFVDLMLPRVLPTLAARLPMRSPSRFR